MANYCALFLDPFPFPKSRGMEEPQPSHSIPPRDPLGVSNCEATQQCTHHAYHLHPCTHFLTSLSPSFPLHSCPQVCSFSTAAATRAYLKGDERERRACFVLVAIILLLVSITHSPCSLPYASIVRPCHPPFPTLFPLIPSSLQGHRSRCPKRVIPIVIFKKAWDEGKV